MTTTPEEILLQKELEDHKFELEKQLAEIRSGHEIALEEKRQEFRTKEVSYTEAGLHMRSLNQFMWQIPGITIAVTGGLWYGVSLWTNDAAKQCALGFLAAFDIAMIFVLHRIRDVLERYITKQRNSNFELQSSNAQTSSTDDKKYLVVRIWSGLLLFAGVLSVIGIIFPERIKSMSQMASTTKVMDSTTPDLTSQPKTFFAPVSSVSAVGSISSSVAAAKVAK